MSLDIFEIDRKIFSNKERLFDFLEGKIVYPINIEIDPSNACNEKCIWCCWEEHRKDKTKMSKEFLEEIVSDLTEVGVKSINWTGGGEPLTNKYVPNIMVFSKSLGIQNGIFSNGTLINDFIAKTLVENCEWVRISWGGSTPETFYKCHGIKKLDKIIEGLSLLKKFKEELNSKTTLGVSQLVVKENYKELYHEAALAKKLGVDYFQGKPDIRMGSEDFIWWDNEVIPLFEQAKKDLEDNKFKILVAQYTQDKYGEKGTRFRDSEENHLNISEFEKSNCYVHNFVTAITANGDIAFCKNLRNEKKYLLGNLKDSSFKEIWNSPRKKEIEKEINSNGCGVFCQNGKLNKTLRYIKTLYNEDKAEAYNYINSIENFPRDKHPNFL
jgi:MoaA/NifB/PqqE/SkfB family radical SAM enzyme